MMKAWDRFWFEARDPRVICALRIAFGALLIINALCLLPDLNLWFSDTGVLPLANARLIINEDAPTLLAHLPLGLCYGLLLASAIALTAGLQPRIAAVVALVMLTSFHDRNYAIVDGEDTLFRLFAFYFALSPCGYAYSVDAWLANKRGKPQAAGPGPAAPIPWAQRLLQLQITVVYLSSAIEKSSGHDWTSGDALYYVARLDDSFGKLPMPSFPFENLSLVHALTWGVLALEWLLPIALWTKRFRKPAIAVAILFHLAIDWNMNLFLFHWLMILGVCSFAEWPTSRTGRRPRPSPISASDPDRRSPRPASS